MSVTRPCLIAFLGFCLMGILSPQWGIAQKNTRFATAADVQQQPAKRRTPMRSCNQWSSYVPDTLHPEFTPIRYVRINVHVIQDAHGKNNFPEKEGREFIKEMINAANQRMQHNQKMLLPHGNHTPAIPVPIRWMLSGVPGDKNDDGIYFHRDDTLFYMNKKARGANSSSVFDPRQYATYGLRKDSVINIFLIEHHPDSIKSKTYKASNDGVGMGPWAKVVGMYYLHAHPVVANGDSFRLQPWDAGGMLNHELGHCLGLSHTWNQDDGCDDTPKNPGCWNFNEPSGCTNVSNNVMDYNAYKNSFTPCQIGKMLSNLSNNLKKYVQPQWCTYDPAQSVTIACGDSVTFTGVREMHGDLIVQNRATLVVGCTLSMAPGSKIILYPRATLIVNGGLITSQCSQNFEGIEMMTRKNDTPVIRMLNGALVEKANHPL